MRKKAPFVFLSTALIGSLALAGCAGSGGSDDSKGEASGESHTLRLALNQTEEHPSFIALESFGERLAEETDGRWDIEVYPNSTLGDQTEYLQSVGDKVIDLAIVSAPQLENLSKDFLVFSLPGVFDSIEHQMDTLSDESVVGDVYTSLEDSNNLTVVGAFTQGTRNIYTKDGLVETPDDLSGMKIRVQESPVFIAMIEALGASPTPMAYSEVYSGLQSGVIDGAENNEISYATQKHFEVAPFYSMTEHLVGVDFLIINSDTLSSMSEDDRAAFDAEWKTTWEEHTELWTSLTEEAIADAEAGGATFGKVDAEAYDEALAPLVDEFVTSDTQRGLYDAIRATAE